MTDERRQRDRDISIAKKMGWTVRKTDYLGCSTLFKLTRPDGIDCGHYASVFSEKAAWNCTPYYSTDPAACMALLVEVMGRGWYVERMDYALDCQLVVLKDYRRIIIRKSTLADPALAFCDAVSQACEAALEAEGGGR